MTMFIFLAPTSEIRDRFFPEAHPFPVTFAVTESLWTGLDFTDQEFQELFETFWGWTCHWFDVYRVGWFNESSRTAVVFTRNESYFFTFPDLASYHEGIRKIREIFTY